MSTAASSILSAETFSRLPVHNEPHASSLWQTRRWSALSFKAVGFYFRWGQWWVFSPSDL